MADEMVIIQLSNDVIRVPPETVITFDCEDEELLTARELVKYAYQIAADCWLYFEWDAADVHHRVSFPAKAIVSVLEYYPVPKDIEEEAA